ncbi:MAG: PfkB family carbohydrate kinase [Phyllobacteriaceae bacterium]|jgi:5-dehydro-2-deoxygluconokinase|nr:PfkB family carbohydrate kinase [Phyllobacteriaceae bacterium]
MMMANAPDIICVGRIAVDLYGVQAHTPLEETRSFARYPGGSSGNTAIAAARAGASVGLISAVGDDPMGAYLLRTLRDEGIDTQAMAQHRDRRTALAFLGMLNSEADGIDFYRTDAADAHLDASKIPPGYFDQAKIVAFTGTHIADPGAFAMVAPIAALAAQAGAKMVLDIDLRRDLWASFEGGLEGSVGRVVEFSRTCALIVGNEEEISLLGSDGSDWAGDLEVIRKLGPNGAVWEHKESACRADGIAISVVNPVGAGDAFLGNVLATWIRTGSRQEAIERGNGAGALVATRHGCSVEMPYTNELDQFLAERDQNSEHLAHLHRSLSRPAIDRPILALACDHRVPFAKLIAKHRRSQADAEAFKQLVFGAMEEGSRGLEDAQPGMLMDPQFGQKVLDKLGNDRIWTGRPIEVTGSRPLETEAGHKLANDIDGWRPGQVAKVLVWFSPDDDEDMIQQQISTLRTLQASCRSNGVEWMLELVPPLDMPRDDETLRRGVALCYRAGLSPDWWKLPALETAAGWSALCEEIHAHDRLCRGVMVLGLNEAIDTLGEKLDLAGQQEICAGFAIGRTIFGDAAEAWFAGSKDDRQATKEMADRYRKLVATFMSGRRMLCAA